MKEQPEALSLAEYWEQRAKDLQTWVDENDYVEFGYRPEGLKREQADQQRTAAELRRLHEANRELVEVLSELSEVQSILDNCASYQEVVLVFHGLEAERDKLKAEIDNIKSVMIAAAEEISAHWDAHCDAEGYGPVNLMHRLERGIPSEYSYKAGDFIRLQNERDALAAKLEAASRDAEKAYEKGWISASTWANRGDLVSDIGSTAYLKDMNAAMEVKTP